MCFDDEFRLCSCDAEALSEEEIGWILRVRDGALEPCRAKGKLAAPPPLSADDVMSKDHVLRELNARNVFDFELEDGRMYWVAVRVPGARAEWMNFVRAEGGTWRFQQRVHPLACPWEPQMVRTGQGIVGVEAEVGGGVARADSESASDPHAGEEGLSFIPGRSDPHAGVDALDAGGAADAPADRALAAHGMAGARPPPPPEPLVALSLDEMHAVAVRLGELAAAESRSAGDVATAESEAPPPAPEGAAVPGAPA